MSFSYTLYTVKGEIFRSARACSELKTRARSCPRTPIWRSLVSSTTRASSENVTSRSCNNFSIITNHLVCRMRTYYPGFKLAEAVWISETKHSSSQVTSVLRDNVCVLFLRNKRIEKLSAKKKKAGVKCTDNEMRQWKAGRNAFFFSIKYANLSFFVAMVA